MLNFISLVGGIPDSSSGNTSENLYTMKMSARLVPLPSEWMAQAKKASHLFLINLSTVRAEITHEGIVFLSPVKHTL